MSLKTLDSPKADLMDTEIEEAISKELKNKMVKILEQIKKYEQMHKM